MWQRTSDAFGGHYGSDALGPVDLGVERIKHHKAAPKEVGDTLRWAPRHNDGKSAALARFHADHADDEATDTLRWRANGVREDRDSRTHAPDRRRIVGLLARGDDEYHEDGVALPPQRSAPARVSSKIGQPTAAQRGGDAEVQYRTAKGLQMEQMRQMRQLKPEELDRLAGVGAAPQGGFTPGLQEAMKDPRVAAALNLALNAPNRMAGDLYKLKNQKVH